MDTRDKLMKRIQMCSFYLTDLHLYLDTHPYCKEALDLFHKYSKLNKEATEEYTEKYGPVSLSDVKDKDKWDWALEQWPWEKGE